MRGCQRARPSQVNSDTDGNWDASRRRWEWSVRDWMRKCIMYHKGDTVWNPHLLLRRAVEPSRLGNIPSKWVCSPLWEAESITQLLWHLENPFTMIETIQLKPLQSLPIGPGEGGPGASRMPPLSAVGSRESPYQSGKRQHRYKWNRQGARFAKDGQLRIP